MTLKIHFMYSGTKEIYCITCVLISLKCLLFYNVIFISLNNTHVFTNSALKFKYQSSHLKAKK